MKNLLLSAALITGAINTNAQNMNDLNSNLSVAPTAQISLTQEWDKVFPKSNKVNHRKVTFVNRYGITLAADMYTPKGANGKLPAIAVSGPFGAVKEQASGLYAQQLAERGFITVAFDPSFTGESDGMPRRVASPDINTEDFSAAVDFLSVQPDVDS
ncbi:MAG: alpha/beta hydrolase, partial [Duncaniella sp.]|nr:alpha/beta hydrolase [Duncaniella sp.]